MNVQHIQSSEIASISGTIASVLDPQTALFLSGGSTPKSLYAYWADNGFLLPGAVALVDERYGKKWHEKSNELMIRETGLVKYLEEHNVGWYPILQDENLSLVDTGAHYHETVESLFSLYQKKVAIMGIGTDAHTAGIAPMLGELENFVASYDKPELYDQGFGPRVTLTFDALKHMDHFFILAFGSEKAHALSQMMTEGPLEEIPARFFMLPEITDRVTLLTDQVVE